MRLELKSFASGLIYPNGAVDWDERSGNFTGQLAAIVDAKAREYGAIGEIEVLHPGGDPRPFAYPVRNPDQLARLLGVMSYRLPRNLAAMLEPDEAPATTPDEIVY